jgi:hypothetical protein
MSNSPWPLARMIAAGAGASYPLAATRWTSGVSARDPGVKARI